jgi:serine/threonine protein kinase
MEPLSCLQHWIDRAGNGLPPHAYKKLARQVLQALRFLHEEWNLIYVGKFRYYVADPTYPILTRASSRIFVDLKPDNVCVRTNHMESVIRHEMVANPPTVAEMGRDALGRDIVLPAGVIPYFSQSLPAWLDEADEVVQDDITAVLIDLGKGSSQSSRWVSVADEVILFSTVRSCDTEHNERVQTTAYRSPEVILGHPWGTAIDIWAFGCLVRTRRAANR